MQSEKPKSSEKNNLYFLGKYSALAFQMAAIIGVVTFAGFKIDQFFDFKFKIFTIVFAFLSVIIAIYFAIKDFLTPKK